MRSSRRRRKHCRSFGQGFEQAIGALTQNKLKTQEKIADLSAVFEGIYQILETALETTRFSRIDQAMNATTDQTTLTMVEQVEGILAETGDRAEKPLMDEAKLKLYTDHLAELIDLFESRMAQLRDEYATRR